VSFQALARLLLPADGAPSLVVEADAGWKLGTRTTSGPRSVIWGRAPAPSGTAIPRLARIAAARERALLGVRVRPPKPYRVSGVYRWRPPRLVAGRLRNRLRDALLGGAIVELVRDPPAPRVLDAVAAAAGHRGQVRRFTASSGGSALVKLEDGVMQAGRILRLAQAGQPADPARAAEGLERLAPLGIGVVPRLLKRGVACGASWSLESALPGRRPAWVTPTIAFQVAGACARLPRAAGGPTALEADLERIAVALPDRSRALTEAGARAARVLACLPLVMRHGDLWAGNLLVDGNQLTGIVDWDSWHPAGVPGTDLLHLLTADTALRTRREMGQVWIERPWTSAAFRSLSAGYWEALDLRPDSDVLEAVGVAWWAGEIGHALKLAPEQARDERWVALNVEMILQRLE
jgi:phosphotransferase family enzyme